MGSRDKDSKSLQDKLKQYFKKSLNAPLPPANELVVTPELEKELGAESPLHRRLKVMREVGEKALTGRVASGGVERLWSATRDMYEDGNSETRHAALGFLRFIVEGQLEQMILMKTVLLQWLQSTHASHCPEDTVLRFRLLVALTNNGKNITSLEEEIGPFLLEWLAQIRSESPMVEMLELMTNIVKFNAAYLEEVVMAGVVRQASAVCREWGCTRAVLAAMELLVAIVSYCIFPPAALPELVDALCRTVCVEAYCRDSWKLMRYVLGADVGRAALLRLLEAMRAGALDGDATRARGAVFFVSTALWGSRPARRDVNLLAVLPTFLEAVESAPELQVLTYEVLLSVQSLLARCGAELDDITYDVVFQILHEVLTHIDHYNPPNEVISARFHEVITQIEQSVEKKQFLGSLDRLYELVDRCGYDRPESSVYRMLQYKRECGFETWVHTAERYVRDARVAVRVHTLQGADRPAAARLLSAGAADSAASVRAAAATSIAVAATYAPTPAALDLLDLLEKILNRPFEMYVTDVSLPPDTDASDVQACLRGLVRLFHRKLFVSPGSLAVRAYLTLLKHLELHYKRPAVFEHLPDVRKQILELFFSVRINAQHQVGFCYSPTGEALSAEAGCRTTPTYSPYVFVGAATGGAAVSAGRAARLVAAVLSGERDWSVLQYTLQALPRLLQHRPVAGRQRDIDVLALTLTNMLSDKRYPECLSTKLSQSEFHCAVLPVLASLAPYHHCLETPTLQRVIRCLLKYGIVLRSAAASITALSVFTLETREGMAKLLPELLLDLSKISDTAAIAGPMLEFLSTLTRLPKVFASFVEDQYMSVFAIILPYTNPSRYNHYVVSLAHHVIAAWFLKCRLKYRRNFVKFIIHGLHNYIIVPFEEKLFKTHNLAAVNEDSSNRKRSSSLGSRGVGRPPLSGRSGGVAALHLELTETCVDLLARYTFTGCSVKPRRTAGVQMLLAGGETRTWLVGHKLVSVTTSGCRQNSPKEGLCERCAELCRGHEEAMRTLGLDNDDYLDGDLRRQNSSENKSEANSEAQPSKLENLSIHTEHRRRSGACPCWCSGWCEVFIRAPSGDVSWVCRMQNATHSETPPSCPLEDISALLAATPRPASIPDPPAPVPPEVSPRTSTQPIDIPASPQRQSSSSTDDEDRLVSARDGKSRHPVRRSNSSPEMSSWKCRGGVRDLEECSPPDTALADIAVLPTCEPQSSASSLHVNKKPKKNELRVSCEAIPEEAPHALQKMAGDNAAGELPPLARSQRAHTISVMSPTRRRREGGADGAGAVSPGFMLLQLYHNIGTAGPSAPGTGTPPTGAGSTPAERPLLVTGDQHERSIKNLDLVPPLETYKVGVLYVGPGQQDDEVAILKNEYGSIRYAEFVRELGTLVELESDPDPGLFLNLEKGGEDGLYTYVWSDDIMRVQFHVATAMPNSDRDPTCNEKRKHIGNDFVSIVYNDSGAEFNIHTIKGQLNFCIVVVEPLEHGLTRIQMKSKDERVRGKLLAHLAAESIVSGASAALMARQLALHCTLASLISRSLGVDGAAPYASNCLERLRIIKRMRARLLAERSDPRRDAPYHTRTQPMDDFTDYM